MGGASITIEESFAYDAHAREKSHSQKIGAQGVSQLISQTEYTPIDQIKRLKLGGLANNPLQTVQYGYNLRDWIQKINNNCGECVDEWNDQVSDHDGNVAEQSMVMMEYNEAALLNESPTHIRLSINREMLHQGQVVYSESYAHIFPVNGPGGDSLFTSQVALTVNGPADPEVIAFELAQALEDATPGIPNMDGSGLVADLTSVRETVIHTTTDLYRREQDPGCLPNEQDLFAQSIIYIADHPDVPGGKRQYNGNINQLHWCIFGREGTEIYGFAYDDLNRLTAAHYPESAQNEAQDFDVAISYADLLGNIGHLSRHGLTGYTDLDQTPTFGLMDDLSYTYAQGQLTQITESGNPDYGYLNAGTGFGYEYGKLVSAGGRGIQLIEYYELNLPKKILTDEGTIEIVYDAEGIKWYQKTTWAVDPPAQYPGGEEEKTYFRGLEIINNQPTALYHAQGRALLAPDGSLLRQEYSLRDHLGNTRVVFSDLDANNALDFSPNSPEIVQTNTYYPFGMLIEGMHPIDQADPVQAYRYNGKELTLMGGLYDYGFRHYDPMIGRFIGVDPIAEKFPHVNVYNYAENEPVGHIDLWGLQKYKPKMQPIDKPSDLLSTKMLNNLWEGIKTAGREFFSKDVGEAFKETGNVIETVGVGVSTVIPGVGVPVAAFGTGLQITGHGIVVIDEMLISQDGLSAETKGDIVVDAVFEILPVPFESAVDKSGLDKVTKEYVKAQINAVNQATEHATQKALEKKDKN